MNADFFRMAQVMAKEGRVTSLLSISAKDLVESKKRWNEVFLQSTGGKECLLVVAKGGAEFFQYIIHQVRMFEKSSSRSTSLESPKKKLFLPLRFGRVRNVATPSITCFLQRAGENLVHVKTGRCGKQTGEG